MLGKEGDSSFAPLKNLPERAKIVGMSADIDSFGSEALEKANCVFCTVSGNAGVNLPKLYTKLPSLNWVHSQLAGIDTILFPAFVNDDTVMLTNAKGIYTRSLVEYVIFAMMYFAKDLPRLRMNQANRNWDPFFVDEISGKVVGKAKRKSQNTGQTGKSSVFSVCAFRMLNKLSDIFIY